MFTILEGINRFLGFLNIKSKLKNRMYIIIGALTTGYIGYLSYNFFHFHAYKRGIIYLIIFILLVYFLLLNIYYYFTEKTVKWDITPYFSKLVEEEEPEQKQSKKEEQPKAKNIDGQLIVYDDDKDEFSNGQLLDASVVLIDGKQEKLSEIVNFLLTNKLVENDYAGIKDSHLKEKTYALGEGVRIPSFSLEKKENQLLLIVGFNATERTEVATVMEIGGNSIEKIEETYEIIPVRATIVGGEYKMPSRASFLTGRDEYKIMLKVALVIKK